MTLQEIYKAGGVATLMNRGLISPSVFMYFKYFDVYTNYRDEGKRYTDAIILTSIAFNVSEKTIKRAVSKLS